MYSTIQHDTISYGFKQFDCYILQQTFFQFCAGLVLLKQNRNHKFEYLFTKLFCLADTKTSFFWLFQQQTSKKLIPSRNNIWQRFGEALWFPTCPLIFLLILRNHLFENSLDCVAYTACEKKKVTIAHPRTPTLLILILWAPFPSLLDHISKYCLLYFLKCDFAGRGRDFTKKNSTVLIASIRRNLRNIAHSKPPYPNLIAAAQALCKRSGITYVRFPEMPMTVNTPHCFWPLPLQIGCHWIRLVSLSAIRYTFYIITYEILAID